MGRYLIRRLLQFIPVFVGATLLIFLMVWAIPGDPIAALAGDRRYMPDTVREQIRDRYNLDDPSDRPVRQVHRRACSRATSETTSAAAR